MSLPSIDVEEFRKVVHTRRSIRVFDGTPIPPEVMRDCLDLALLSPNSSNLQCWEFYWVRTQAMKEQLAKVCLSQPAARTAAELIVCVARTRTWRRNSKELLRLMNAAGDPPKPLLDYYQKLVPMVYGQGPLGLGGLLKKIIVFFRGLFTPTPREPASAADMRVWAVKTTALAAQTLMLSLRAHGFDSCPIEGYDSSRLRRLLNLPSDAETVMVIGAGKRTPEGVYGERVRLDRSLFIREL